MFRRLKGSLPKDPEFPANLTNLGYFINEMSQIKSIWKPDDNFNFFITNNDRYNEIHREAVFGKLPFLRTCSGRPTNL